MTEQSKEERRNAIHAELAELHAQDLQGSQHRDVFSDVPLKPVPLTAFKEIDKREARRAELHEEMRRLAFEAPEPSS
jgi:hypothetical protein